MELVRFIQFGPDINGLLHTLRDKLNAVQSEFLFTFEDDVISAPKSFRPRTEEFSTTQLEKKILQYSASHRYVEYPICITGYRLTDEFLYTSTDHASFISIAAWDSFSNNSLSKGLAFCVAAVLIDRKLSTDLHDKSRGCPNDLCWDKSDIDLGLAKCDYCRDCQKAIYAAIGRGTISLNEITAVYCIFDAIADRKYCFVMMPFQKQFDGTYAVLKEVLESCGCSCRRADEISRTTNIEDIILEQIGRSSLIVADLTGRNANVFYELGYAHASGKNTILIVQKGETVPFDINHRRYVEYDPADLKTTLADPIRGYI